MIRNNCYAQVDSSKWEGNIELLNFFNAGNSRKYNIKYQFKKQNYLRATVIPNFKRDFTAKKTHHQFDLNFQLGVEKRFKIYDKVTLYAGILSGIKLTIANIDQTIVIYTPPPLAGNSTQITNTRIRNTETDLTGAWGVIYFPTKRIFFSLESQIELKYQFFIDRYNNYVSHNNFTYNFIPLAGVFIGYKF